MPTSQNVRFLGQAPQVAGREHPEGAGIAQLLELELRTHSWTTKPIENWRDGGWSVDCSKEGEELQIAVARIDPDGWMLQVTPINTPGALGRLFGKVPSASPAGVLELAKGVQEVLSTKGHYNEFKWCWDGYPQEGSPEPGPPP